MGIKLLKMNYFVVGTNNMEVSAEFYDSLFEASEVTRISSTERMIYWQCDDFTFAIARPFNEERASNGNGTMIGFSVGSREEVKRLHKKVIELGGSCDGEPNQRGLYYSAYVRDLDKNKICFYQ